MKRIFILLFPFFPFVIFLSHLFFQIEFFFEKEKKFYIFNPKSQNFEEKVQKSTIKPEWYITHGLIQGILFTHSLIQDLKTDWKEVKSKFSTISDILSKRFLSQILILAFYIFYIFLCLSSFFSLYKRTWFSPFLNQFMYFIFFFYLLQNTFSLISKFNIFPNIIRFFLLKNTLLLIYNLFCFFHLKRTLNKDNLTFRNLIYLQNEKKVINSTNISVLKTIIHLTLILLTGLIIGNLVYIPFFILQKNFTNKFSFIFLCFIFFLFIFYIKSYIYFAAESKWNKLFNLSVGFSFLQYRILKNSIFGFLLTLIVTFFFTLLVVILFLNINILENNFLFFNQKSYF